MIKRSSNLFLALSLVFSIVSSLFMPVVTYASSSNIIDQSSTSTGNLSSVAFGNNMFVAVGRGSLSKSVNGVDWSVIANKVGSPNLTSIVFASGKFVAIDNSEKAVYTSLDGENWTRIVLAITPERLKAVNGKLFVWQSVYKNGTNPPSYNVTLLQSTDGVVWTDTKIASTNGTFGMQSLTDIAYGQDKYVVSANNAVYYTSTNLTNWTTVTLTDLVINHYNSSWPLVTNVIYLKDRFFSYIVTHHAKKVFTSTNGVDWTVDASWDNKQFYGGAFLNGENLLFGKGEIYNSAAAPLSSTQWKTTDTQTTMMVNNMVYGNGVYVASGSSGLLISSDLMKWTDVNANLQSIASDSNGNYVAVSSGEYGSIYKSNGSGVWNGVTPSKLPGINAVTYGSGKYVAVTNKDNNNLNAKVVTSTGGDIWSVKDSGVLDNLKGVAYGANQYVAVSDYGGIYSSADGNTWSMKYRDENLEFNTVAFLNNQFIAVGIKYDEATYEQESVVIAKSSNGIQWDVPKEIGFPHTSLKGIAYDGKSYILVGEDTLTQQAAILTTVDLTTFVQASISASALSNISFGQERFLAVGVDGGLFSSVDGTSWTSEASGLTANLNGIIYDGTHFKVVGDHFSKMTMNLGPTQAHSITASAATLTPIVGEDNAITLTVKNSLGNTDTTFTGVKEVTVSGYSVAPDGTYGSLDGIALTASLSNLNVTFAAGVAQVNLKLHKAEAQSIVFSQAGVVTPSATLLNIAPVAGDVATMELTKGISAPQTNGGSFLLQPVITLLDYFGNVNVADNSTVVSTSKKDTGKWTLTGSLTKTAVAGVVSFIDLGAINATGIDGAQLAFDTTGLKQITSNAINLPWPKLGAPVLQPAVPDNRVIGLTWNPVMGAVGYDVYQGLTAGIYDTKVATLSESVYNYNVTGLTNGHSYYFVVKAFNPEGESLASNEVSAKPRTTPAAPTNITAVAGDSEATVTFTVPSNNGGSPITRYEVTASPSGVVGSGASSPITVTGLQNGTAYTFTVKAINDAGSSVNSDVSNFVIPQSPILPTLTPTVEPSAAPTATPTAAPTAAPTATPTATPTAAPTATPTATPTAGPTVAPTAGPTAEPTATPTAAPTATPTATPTVEPTAGPTVAPTAGPTAEPTATPTAAPTATPTATPTVEPTAGPTVAPTAGPTAEPTVTPTAVPTATPTAVPTATPTVTPTAEPTVTPTAVPTVTPTATPTVAPTATPTAAPTLEPTISLVPTAPITSAIPSTTVDILVNGKIESAGSATSSELNGQTTTTIVVDQAKIEQRLAEEGQQAIVTIPVTASSDVIVGELNGQIIKDMEQKQAVLIIQTPKGTYTLPTAQLDISAISEQFGNSVSLQDIIVQITVSAPTADTLRGIEMLVAQEGLTLVAQPLDFTVKVTYGGKTIEVSKFNTYVERMIPLVDGVDLNKITTGLVFETSGTIRHVPTQIVVDANGKMHAKIHSLTNSTYFVVQNPQNFKDVTSHWAKDMVNEMGSRMVIDGIGNDLFNPNEEITRAEFAAIIVRGLGLELEKGTTSFTDVKISDWYSSAVQTAYTYKLINGFEDGNFHPADKITREQAMSIIAKAMLITDLKAKLPSKEPSDLLSSYADANKVSEWAKNSIADSLQAGIITGRSGNELAPKALVTRAEVATIIQRLLQQSNLI